MYKRMKNSHTMSAEARSDGLLPEEIGIFSHNSDGSSLTNSTMEPSHTVWRHGKDGIVLSTSMIATLL